MLISRLAILNVEAELVTSHVNDCKLYHMSSTIANLLYTVHQELFVKENFRDMSIVTVFARKRSRI